MDLNGFEKINDTNGHDTGDAVLKKFAKRVSGCLRENDTMARLGGDEFVVLAEGVRVLEHARILAGKIVAALDLPLPGSAIMHDVNQHRYQHLRFSGEYRTIPQRSRHQGASNSSAIAAFVEETPLIN